MGDYKPTYASPMTTIADAVALLESWKKKGQSIEVADSGGGDPVRDATIDTVSKGGFLNYSWAQRAGVDFSKASAVSIADNTITLTLEGGTIYFSASQEPV